MYNSTGTSWPATTGLQASKGARHAKHQEHGAQRKVLQHSPGAILFGGIPVVLSQICQTFKQLHQPQAFALILSKDPQQQNTLNTQDEPTGTTC